MRKIIAGALALVSFASLAHAEPLKVAISQRGFWDSSFVEFAEAAGFFKEAGLEVSDRIALRYEGPISRAFERYADFIAQEALATKISQGLDGRGHKWEGELNGVAGKLELEKE